MLRTRPWQRIALLLTIFAVGYVALDVHAYQQESATWDEPIHLTSGYLALARHDYRIDPSHPPFLRMLAATPLLMMDVVTPNRSVIDRASPEDWALNGANYDLAHRFMYRDNDADRLLYAARFTVVLLGVLAGVLLFCWAYEWLGLAAAASVLLFYCLSPNLGAHASLVTTDFGLTCFSLGALYCLWRTSRRASAGNIAGLAAFFSLAIVSKFSGLILAPILAGLLVVAVRQRTAITARLAGQILAILPAAAFAAVWAVHGFQYAPDPSSTWVFRFHDTAAFQRDVPTLSALAGWVDAHRLLPNAFTEGLLFFCRSMVLPEPSYLAGQYSQQGWWYYFLVAFLIKTPVSLLIMAGIGAFTFIVQRRELGAVNEAFVVLPMAVYLGSAMASHLDIGVRHILPVDPLVLLLAAAGARQLLMAPRLSTRFVFVGLAFVWIVRFGSIYPDRLAFFNRLAGGPEHGLEYLADSNLDWGQDLKSLKRWMEAHHVPDINLAYFGQADPAYYGIKCTYLPGAPDFAANAIDRPKLPGYVAISATVLSGVYLDPAWRLYYRGFRNRAPIARIGYSIHVYWVDRWPDMGDPADPTSVEAEQVLANGLLKQAWYTRAIVHYRRYLAHHPQRSSAWNGLGLALAASGQAEEALATFRRSANVDPSNGRSHLYLATALVDSGQAGEALLHARRAVELRPADPLVHRVLGRALAAAGNLRDAVSEYERAVELDPGDARTREDLGRIRVLVSDAARRLI